MLDYLLLALIIFSGVLSGMGNKSFDMAKAFFMVSIETAIDVLLFIAFIYLFNTPFLSRILIPEVSSLFLLILFIAILNGIILYWSNRIIIPKFKISCKVQSLCEYIIQWSLIYITIYQVMFDNLISVLKKGDIENMNMSSINISNPSDLIVLVLPSLISVWISIILYKVYKGTI